MQDKVKFVRMHEHPEGGDRGGYAEETHTFLIHPDSRVEHSYWAGCDEPADFGLEDPSRLVTKEDAVSFVDFEIRSLKEKLAGYEELREKLLTAGEYLDAADYGDEDEEEESDEDDE